MIEVVGIGLMVLGAVMGVIVGIAEKRDGRIY